MLRVAEKEWITFAFELLGDLQDLDGPLLLLTSGASRFMTGAVITVDGGHLLSQL
jgi:hypothetical protein